MQCLSPGSYGSLPAPISAACVHLSTQVERNPDRFHRLAYQRPLRRCRARIARLIGAETDECVLVPNTSHGLDTILWNIAWEAGDVIVSCAWPPSFPSYCGGGR